MTYSYSRSKMLDTCARSYYYSYYASKNGWRQDFSQRTKLIYRLKKLQSVNSIVGVGIYSAITNLIVNPSLTKQNFKRSTNTKIYVTTEIHLQKKRSGFKILRYLK